MAKYYRMMTAVLRQKIKTYEYSAEDMVLVEKELEWHRSNAIEFQAKANQLKGEEDDGQSKSIRSTGMPSELPGQSEQFAGVNCTTVM